MVAALFGALIVLALPAAASAAPPTLTIDPVTTHGITTAHVSGEVSAAADGGEIYWGFQYSTDGVVWNGSTFDGGWLPSGESAPVFQDLSGLSAGTSYQVRLGVFNAAEGLEEFSSPVSFETDTAPVTPTTALGSPEDVLYTTAHLSGTFNPEGGNEDSAAGPVPLTGQLELNREGEGWNPVGDSRTVEGADAVSSEDFAVEADPSDLKPGADYKLRLAVRYAGLEVFSTEDEFTTLAVTPPSAEDLQVTNVTSSSAHFSAKVKTNAPGSLEAAGETAYAAHWSFTPGTSSGTVAATEAEEVVSGKATGLEPHHPYTATFTVSNAGGTKEVSVPFETEGAGPDIGRETLWEPTSTSIQLNAQVNAHNSALTDCHFEYGTTTAYGQSAPCESPLIDGTYVAPADNSDHVVSARISGLQPSTEYQFRLVATNGTGEAQGDDRSFTALAAHTPENCSNQDRRDEQRSNQLPDCRAWEMVSPLSKGNGDIVGDGLTTVAAKDGDAVAYSSRTQFADAVGSGVSGETQYLGRRAADGWSTKAITPAARPDAGQTIWAPTKVQVFSEDLRSALVLGYDLPGGGGTPERNGLFLEDSATRALQPLTISQQDKPSPFDLLNLTVLGLSADAHHVAFVSSTLFLPSVKQAQEPGGPQNSFVQNVYQSDDGVISLAGILPDGSYPPEGSNVFLSSTDIDASYRAAMSADGSRQLFNATPEPFASSQLYQRIDGNRTVWISEPEGSNLSLPRKVILQGASPDGETVFFVSNSRLLDDDENDGPDLYRWRDSADPELDDNLTLISRAGDVPGDDGGGALVGFSGDAELIYYHTLSNHLMVWDHGTIRMAASPVTKRSASKENLTVTASRPGAGRVSPDGMHMAFVVKDTVDGVHGLTGRVTNERFEMYVYDLANDTLNCVSCPEGSASSDARVSPSNLGNPSDGTAPTEGNPAIENAAIRPRFINDSGEVFFSTGEPLVSEDTNGVFDAYAYDSTSGRLGLLSSGKGKSPSAFTDASASGKDVFIVTRNRLIASDTDELVDLYDVRVDGGFAEVATPPLPPCAGEACQGASPPSPSAPWVGSAVSARGNLKQPRHRTRCRGHKRRAGKCRTHKHHKHDMQHQHRTANNNRRVAK